MKYRNNAVVIGNGESRKDMDLGVLSKYAYMIGCNALYREFSPNSLVCVDRKMCIELGENGYADRHRVYARYPDVCPKSQKIFRDPQFGSGATAAHIAAGMKYKNIFLIGFDLFGGSLYDGSPNYPPKKASPDPARFDEFKTWISQLHQVFGNHPLQKFYLIQPRGQTRPVEWRCHKNLFYIESSELFPHLTRYEKAVVLGNGESRMGLNLDEVRLYAILYGCNALYRDYAPDVLFCVDPKMVKEINRVGYAKEHVVYTRNDKHCKDIRVIPNDPGWSCGPTAVRFACGQGFERVFLVGHDLHGGRSGLINNMYKGTENYAPTCAKPTYFGNWVNQLTECFKNNLKTEFVRTSFGEVPKEWKVFKNLRHISLSEFMVELKKNTGDGPES